MARVRRVLRGQRVTVFLLVITAGLFVALAADGYWDGRCYNEVLSPDPMQCYALEQAEADDLIEIDSMYGVPNGRLALFHTNLLIEEAKPRNALRDRLRAYALDFIAENPQQGSISSNVWICADSAAGESKANCVADVTITENWIDLGNSDFDRIILYESAIDSLEDFAGWATWTEVWPDDDRGEKNSRTTRSASGQYDLSDIDIENIPPFECETVTGFSDRGIACHMVRDHPELPIGGAHGRSLTAYVQIKAENLQDPIIETAGRALTSRNSRVLGEVDKERSARENATGIVLVPVKYSLEELWRYAYILRQFKKSASNDLGIVGVRIDYNYPIQPGPSRYLIDSLADVNYEDPDFDFRDYREFIHLQLNHDDLDDVARELPRLLRQLGIPEDAVGRISYPEPIGPGPLVGKFDLITAYP